MSQSGKPSKPSPKYEEITVHGTGRLLRGLRELGFRVEQFVFSSTMLVHRPGEPGEFLTEDWPLEPTWAYPAAKVRTEQLIRDERDALSRRAAVLALVVAIGGMINSTTHVLLATPLIFPIM